MTIIYVAKPIAPAWAIIITILCGIIGGIVAFFFWEIGIYAVAAYGGYTLALAIAGFATLTSAVATYIITAIFIILACLAVHYFERLLIILATSIGGSFAFIYGLDYFVRTGFQYILLYLHPSGSDSYVFPSTWKFYLMLVGWLVLAIGGIAFEWWKHEEMILEDKWGLRAWLERVLCCCHCCGRRKKTTTGGEVKVISSGTGGCCASKRSKAPAKVVILESPADQLRNEKLRNAGVKVEQQSGWGWW